MTYLSIVLNGSRIILIVCVQLKAISSHELQTIDCTEVVDNARHAEVHNNATMHVIVITNERNNDVTVFQSFLTTLATMVEKRGRFLKSDEKYGSLLKKANVSSV